MNFLKNISLKKLDKLLTTSFIPPFIVTFFIALFVLVMQTLWLYIDDIAGKGVGFFILVELVSYMSVSMIPMALPIAVLISSVMVLGNLAEKYELSSIKSAGVSLWRVMIPLMLVTLVISVLSFFCSNNLIPVSNLQFKSRLYDIRKQKPTLSMEEGMFNRDFQGYAIRLGNKLNDNKSIEDVLVYDHREEGQGRLISVTADRGLMYTTDDDQYFVMELYDGNQYNETKPTKKDDKESYPFVRTSFKSWTKIFDLNEFDMNQTDRELFKSHHSMLSSRQLLTAIDSIDSRINTKIENLKVTTDKYYYFYNKERIAENRKKTKEKNNRPATAPKIEKKEVEKVKKNNEKTKTKSNKSKTAKPKKNRTVSSPKPSKNTKSKQKNNKPKTPSKKDKKADTKKSENRTPIAQTIEKPLSEYNSFLETLDKSKKLTLSDKAKTFARSIQSSSSSTNKTLKRIKESRVKHVFEFHYKFSMAIACFIFLFIGAPMGAIVKKGGFGWPLLISIVFFMIFVVLTIFSKNIAERFVIDAVFAAWLPCLIVFPIGLYLTWEAMRDSNGRGILSVFTFIPKLILEQLKKRTNEI